jgi:predicted nucleic acid-binding protein
LVDEGLHQSCAAAYLAGLPREVSFVDIVSFQMMRGLDVDQAFAFDRDFSAEGFGVVP